MSFEQIRKIPSPEEIIALTPMTAKLEKIKAQRDEEIKKVFTGEDNRFLVIIGPCSASDEDALCDYVIRLARVYEKIKDKVLVIPRIYTNKPRTTGEGYKGMLHQPDPGRAPNMLEGILSIRRMHIRATELTHLTSADEMLYPSNLPYVSDLLSYIAVGARSVENQQHRLTASGIDVPVGMKNPTSGDLSVMFNSIKAAQLSHDFLYQGYEVRTSGNPLAHAIMRGSVNKHGEHIPNYHYEDLIRCAENYEKGGYKNPAIVVDTNHSNSKKKYSEQSRITKEILHSKRHSPVLNKMVKGVMIESYIEEGNQPENGCVYGKSITDACIGWEETENLLYYIADNLE